MDITGYTIKAFPKPHSENFFKGYTTFKKTSVLGTAWEWKRTESYFYYKHGDTFYRTHCQNTTITNALKQIKKHKRKYNSIELKHVGTTTHNTRIRRKQEKFKCAKCNTVDVKKESGLCNNCKEAQKLWELEVSAINKKWADKLETTKAANQMILDDEIRRLKNMVLESHASQDLLKITHNSSLEILKKKL